MSESAPSTKLPERPAKKYSGIHSHPSGHGRTGTPKNEQAARLIDETPHRSFTNPTATQETGVSSYKRMDLARRYLEESLDELEALKRTVILAREDSTLHAQRMAEFSRKEIEVSSHLAAISLRGNLKEELGDYGPKAYDHYKDLLNFQKREARISDITNEKQEMGLHARPAETAHALEVDERMRADKTLIPAYLETKKRLAASKRVSEQERTPYINLLQKRLGDIVPEELDQLAEDPSSISQWRQGWEWLRSKIDATFLPTTKLLAAYRAKNDAVKAIERELASQRSFIERGTRDPARTVERVSPKLETIHENVTELLSGSLETPRQIDQFVFATQQLEAQLTTERARSPYETLATAEQVLHEAVVERQRLQAATLADAEKKTAQQPNDLIARELVLFSSPRFTQESRQYAQFSGLFDVNPDLQQAHLALSRIFIGPDSAHEQRTAADTILRAFSPTEQRILVTMTRHWNEHCARVKTLEKYNALANSRKHRVDLHNTLERARPVSDIVEVLQIAPLPIELSDQPDTTAQARIARLTGDLKKIQGSPEKLAAAYDRLISIWIQRRVDEEPSTHAIFDRAKDALKNLFHASFRREIRDAYGSKDLQTSIDLNKGSLEPLIQRMLKDGIMKKALPRFHLDQKTADQLLRDILMEETYALLPEEVHLAMESEQTKQHTMAIYEVWNSVDADPDSLQNQPMSADQRAARTKSLVKNGIEEDEAFAIVESILQAKNKERMKRLRELKGTLSKPMQEAFPNEKLLHLTPLLVKIDTQLKGLMVKRHTQKFHANTLNLIFNEVIRSQAMQREDVKELMEGVRAKFQE